MQEEIQWSESTPVFANLSSLFDIYYTLLMKKGSDWNNIKYKTEIIVNAVMTQVNYLQLLPDILVKYLKICCYKVDGRRKLDSSLSLH